MDSLLREQFVVIVMRFKRIDICPSAVTGLQQSELAVMKRASAGCLCDGEGMCVSDIQQKLHISKPAVSQILNNLERKGYIVRTIAPGDRRKITVTLTPAGEQILAETMCTWEQLLDEVLEQFGTANVTKLTELMNHLMDILDEQYPGSK